MGLSAWGWLRGDSFSFGEEGRVHCQFTRFRKTKRKSSTVIPLEKNDLGSQDGLGFVAASSALLSMSENVIVVFQSMLSSLLIGSLGGHTLNIHAISKLIDLRR